ncbi:hypothetical protein WICMUC_003696 [Wickerhamomyces mucosus]|uniref:Aminotransferase class I/classII large domain-containing protein n=1 Tax=Wickerhamomyces mucosus TaxID=1378264 RepID=A0A9P8PL47_9ASCO|nr:hypothetical protein WICMUC_003696 [Wickerhamomyces mucosus]
MTIDYETKYAPNISERSKGRKLNSFYSFDAPKDLVAHPNPIHLAGGTPNEGFFPVESIHFNLIEEPFQHLDYSSKSALTNKFDINVKTQLHQLNETATSHTYRYTEDKDLEIDIAQAFQYGHTDGTPQLKNFTKKLVENTNKPAYNDWDIILTNGSGDSLHKIADLFIEKDSTILVEEFTFNVFNTGVTNLGGINIPVKINLKNVDNDPNFDAGIDTEYLADLLDNWGIDEAHYKGLKKPKALYTIPTGQNPTGLSQTLEKRKKIYEIAEKHDIIIVEDDPYGYIILPKYEKGAENPYAAKDFSIEKYKKEFLKPSYLTIDRSGRVIRLETFSKLFAPGLRLGFIVANKYLIGKIFLHQALTTRQPSGVSQLVFNNIVAQWGGVDGWIKWATKIAKHYTERRDVLLTALYETEAFKKGLFSVVEPDAGMFIIVYVNFEKQIPDATKWDAALIQLRLLSITHGVELVFGNKMATDLSLETTLKHSNFLRITVAAVARNEDFIIASERLNNVFIEFFDKLNNGGFDKLLK